MAQDWRAVPGAVADYFCLCLLRRYTRQSFTLSGSSLKASIFQQSGFQPLPRPIHLRTQSESIQLQPYIYILDSHESAHDSSTRAVNNLKEPLTLMTKVPH
jgi:hypothetical protein